MGSIYRVYTVRMDRARLEHVLARARKCHRYEEGGRRGEAIVTLCRPSLPDLAGYGFADPRYAGGVRIRGEHGPALPAFWRCLTELRDSTEVATLVMDVGEAGRAFDPDDRPDLILEVGWAVPKLYARLMVGRSSPGIADIGYRAELFRRFLHELGLDRSLRVLAEDGRMDLEVADPEWLDVTDLAPSPETQACARSKCTVQRNFVEKPPGANFLILEVELLPCLELGFIAGASRVLDALGGPARIVRSEVRVNSSPAQYDAVRALLNPKPFGPWRLMFTAVSRYRISDLDQIVAETKEVLFRAFKVKPRGVGPVMADLDYADGTFMLTFTASCETERQTQALERFVADLGEGEDIVDHTPT